MQITCKNKVKQSYFCFQRNGFSSLQFETHWDMRYNNMCNWRKCTVENTSSFISWSQPREWCFFLLVDRNHNTILIQFVIVGIDNNGVVSREFQKHSKLLNKSFLSVRRPTSTLCPVCNFARVKIINLIKCCLLDLIPF